MKLTKKQKELLAKGNWDIINNKHGNAHWISLSPEDGYIFGDLCDVFSLTGDEEDIKLLVVATKEGE